MSNLIKKNIISELKYVYSENNTINVLVENKMEKQNKLFGRNKYISPVIFDGNENLIGKVVKVKVQNSNQNTLFGILDKKMEAA